MTQFDSTVAGSLDIAQTEAIERKNSQLEPIHLIYGLLKNPQTKVSKSYPNHQKNLTSLLNELPSLQGQNFSPATIKPSTTFSQWITYASAQSIQSGRQAIEESDLAATLQKASPELAEFLSATTHNSEEETEIPPFLTNLNDLAAQGKLDPVIGRTKEIRAVMEILGRRAKNNPILVGEAGVGKTAVVEGLADLIHRKQVPDTIKGKTIWSLDMGSLMAGTKFRGEFEERLQKLIQFIKSQAETAILFIDELHQLVGAGKTDGPMDAANLLKPALARGDLACIGATTQDEYRRHILNDSALERRFRAVPILEPSAADAIEIMMGLKEKFEIHHGIDISDQAIFSSVFLSNQYINDKNLPDKAIDLIDEAASSLKLSAEAMPPELAELEAEIRTQMIYSKTERADQKIYEEIERLQSEFKSKKQSWEKEVHALKELSVKKNDLEQMKFKLEQALASGDYEKASQLKYQEIPEQEKDLEKFKTQWTLKEQDIAQVISRQTGIPIEKILRSQQQNMLELPTYLKNSIFGQDNALEEIAGALMASHAGLTDSSRPLGSFLLTGPSGVGKTETAKALARFLFNSDQNIIRLDMTEYSEKHGVAKLIGAPPGYVGYEDGGVLTEAIRKRPYSVILFDEVEKAHTDFADILLQILDDGRLTDNKGRVANFQNTIIIMTSNSKRIEQDFKPEVLGRIDGILPYQSLDESTIEKLLKNQLLELNEKLKDRNIEIELKDSLREAVLKQGYDNRYGARPLKSVFARLVSRPLAKTLLEGKSPQGVLYGEMDDLGRVKFS